MANGATLFRNRITQHKNLRKHESTVSTVSTGLIVLCCGIQMARIQHVLSDGEINWFMTCPICKRELFVQQLEGPHAGTS